MIAGDTIAACATPWGHAHRAMVRLSGPMAMRAAGCHGPSAGRALLRTTISLGSLRLPVLLAAFPAPHSYTGEDLAELQFAGSPFLVERVLQSLTSLPGVRLAQPGEFTARAYFNGRLTLQQAEGVAAVISAGTREQLDAARDLLAGRTGDSYRALTEELATLLALVEAGIDFTDQEDVVAIDAPTLARRLTTLRDSITRHLGGEQAAESLSTLPRVALVGRPNSGKSTLFNALLGRRRAVASPHAGTTRDVLSETLDLSHDAPGAPSVLLQDLAGLDEHAGPDQSAARAALAAADLLLWCDPTGRFDARPLSLPPLPTLRVRTFADQPHPTHPHATREDLAVCALDGWRLPMLRRAIADAATVSRGAGIAALLPRHRRALLAARTCIDEALALIQGAARIAEPEVVAQSLRLALDELAELSGRITPDDVLGRVFASFCVGK
jgi:tRNA modification GTPase